MTAGRTDQRGDAESSAATAEASADVVSSWDAFFEPRTVCVVGASGDPRRIGGRLVRYSLESGFEGRIIPVNPTRDEVFGIPTLSSLTEVDERPDWVIIALGPEHVLGVLEQAGSVGARNVSIVSAGYAESGPEGRALQDRIVELGAKGGMRILGPNTNGFMHVAASAFFAFTPVIDSARPVTGDIAVVSQSAAIGTYFVNWARHLGLGLRHWVHTGNEADITLLEVARQLLKRGERDALALSFEVLRDAEMLQEILELAASTGTSVAVLPTGLSSTGRRAAEAHTAALIQDDAKVLADLLADAGVFVAPSIGDVMGFLQVAVHGTPVNGVPRLGCVTTSGGVGVLMADAADSAGVEMPLLSDEMQSTVREIAPYSHPANPIDTTAQVINEPDRFQAILEACAQSPELDVVAAFIAHGLAGAEDITLGQVRAVGAKLKEQGAGGRLAALGLITPEGSRSLQEQAVSVFYEPRDLANALGALATSAAARDSFAQRLARWPACPDLDASGSGTSALDELESKRLLAAAGADVVEGHVVDSPASAARTAASLGWPVVMKLVSAGLVHKAAAGGVELGVDTPHASEEAYERLARLRGELGLEADGQILVERMLQGQEVFVGAIRHPQVGPILGVGAGGAGVEESRRVTWSWPVVSPKGLASAIAANLGSGTSISEKSLEAMVRVTQGLLDVLTGAERPVVAIECNPVIVTPDGRATVVDALVELAEDV